MNVKKRIRRLLCRATYLLPFLTSLFLVIYAAIPHLWFIHDGRLMKTQSLFSLVQNTWTESANVLGGAEASSYAVYFSHVMRAVAVVFWVSMGLYLLFSLMVAVCSTVAFAFPPVNRYANRTKRVLHLLCPNRILYLLFLLLPLLWTFFPQILLRAYLVFFGYRDSLHYFWVADWIPALVLVVLSLLSFLLTLSLQADTRLDLFRIYRAKKDLPPPPTNEEEAAP